ncbi:transcription initiation factor TFIID subunit 7 [Conglomerata obtusa]
MNHTFLLSLPPTLHSSVATTLSHNDYSQIAIYTEHGQTVFQYKNRKYRTIYYTLPTIVEIQKTTDRTQFFKSGNVSNCLYVIDDYAEHDENKRVGVVEKGVDQFGLGDNGNIFDKNTNCNVVDKNTKGKVVDKNTKGNVVDKNTNGVFFGFNRALSAETFNGKTKKLEQNKHDNKKSRSDINLAVNNARNINKIKESSENYNATKTNFNVCNNDLFNNQSSQNDLDFIKNDNVDKTDDRSIFDDKNLISFDNKINDIDNVNIQNIQITEKNHQNVLEHEINLEEMIKTHKIGKVNTKKVKNILELSGISPAMKYCKIRKFARKSNKYIKSQEQEQKVKELIEREKMSSHIEIIYLNQEEDSSNVSSLAAEIEMNMDNDDKEDLREDIKAKREILNELENKIKNKEMQLENVTNLIIKKRFIENIQSMKNEYEKLLDEIQELERKEKN